VVGPTSLAEQPATPPRVSDNGAFGGGRPERASSGGSSGGGSGSSGGGGKVTAATQPAGAPTAPTAAPATTPAAAATAPAHGQQKLSRGARRRRNAQTAAAAAAAASSSQLPPPAVVAKPAPEPPARAPAKQWADLLRSPSQVAVAEQLPAATQPAANSEAAGGPWHTMGAKGRSQQQQGQQQQQGRQQQQQLLPSASPRPISAGRPAGPRAAAVVAKQGPGGARAVPVGVAAKEAANEASAEAGEGLWQMVRARGRTAPGGTQQQQQQQQRQQRQQLMPRAAARPTGAGRPAGPRAAAGGARAVPVGAAAKEAAPQVSWPALVPVKGGQVAKISEAQRAVAPAGCYRSALVAQACAQRSR